MSDSPQPSVPVLVSACLLGRRCRYDGASRRDGALEAALRKRGEEAHPFCPEEHGGLGTPRPAASLTGSAGEVLDGRAGVRTCDGADVREAFLAGAKGAFALCQQHGIRRAYLKERSPSCGVRTTSVRGERVPGMGLTSELLSRNEIEVIGAEGGAAESSEPSPD